MLRCRSWANAIVDHAKCAPSGHNSDSDVALSGDAAVTPRYQLATPLLNNHQAMPRTSLTRSSPATTSASPTSQRGITRRTRKPRIGHADCQKAAMVRCGSSQY